MTPTVARLAGLAAVVGLLAIVPARAQGPADVGAQEAKKSWLALGDTGQYLASWDTAASVDSRRPCPWA
jgi:hypothetical protein